MSTALIRIDEELKKKLDKLKAHPRQSYDEVIDNILSGKNLVEQNKAEKRLKETIKQSEEVMKRMKKLQEKK